MTQFGRHLRSLWHLEPDGDFPQSRLVRRMPEGGAGRAVGFREEMERQPDVFFRREVSPRAPTTPCARPPSGLARFVGTTGERIAFVTNATEAVNTVLRAVELKAGRRNSRSRLRLQRGAAGGGDDLPADMARGS